MVTLSIPPAATALADLDDLLQAVGAAVELGDAFAAEFFDAEARLGVTDPENDYLYPDLVRYKVLHQLRPRMSELSMTVEELPNIGLLLTALRAERLYRLRLRKADQGEVPSPGQSETLIDFYNQPQQLVLLPPAEVRLVLFWEFIEPSHELRLSLACPHTGGWSRDAVSLHWCDPVPLVTLPRAAPTADGDLEEDLPAEAAYASDPDAADTDDGDLPATGQDAPADDADDQQGRANQDG